MAIVYARTKLDLGFILYWRNDDRFLHETHQLSYRSDTELLHHPAAMNFHCFLRHAKFAAHLFVQHSGNHELHHFELARC